MTRDEVIDILNDERLVIWTDPEEECYARRQNEAIDMAIESLKAPTENTNTPTDTPTDLISRQAAVDAIEAIPDSNWRSVHYANAIRNIPSAEPIHGKWNRLASDTFHCKMCGHTFIVMQGEENMNFCPNCGAKMKGVDDEID